MHEIAETKHSTDPPHGLPNHDDEDDDDDDDHDDNDDDDGRDHDHDHDHVDFHHEEFMFKNIHLLDSFLPQKPYQT